MSEVLDNFSTVIASLATVVAVYIAWMGLSTWKTQIRWQTDHDLARRLLVEIYRFRDAVAAARSPFIWADELRADTEDGRSFHRNPQQSHADNARAYQRRYAAIDESGPQLYALLLEAQAVWGPDLSDRWRKVKGLKIELWSHVQLYLDYTNPDNQSDDFTSYYPNRAALETARNVVHSIGEVDGRNDFSHRFSNAIAEVEDYLRKKLGRNSE